MENQIRENQDALWQELSTVDREDMLLRAGIPKPRNREEKEWLEQHSREAETRKVVSVGMAHAIQESFKIMKLN